MIIIQEIAYSKKKGCIVASGEKYDNLSLSVMLKFAFKKGDEVTSARFKEFLKESEEVAAKDYLFALLARGARTEKEAANKLYQKGFSKRSVAGAVELAKSYGYLSDADYVKNYISTHSHSKGGFRIKRELKEKGIPSQLVESLLNEVELDETGAALAVAQKFIKNRTLDDKTKQRLFRHLAARGFSYDTIRQVMSQIGVSFDEE